MKLEATVKIGNVVAYFTITPEGHGVYHAGLIGYQGSHDFAPPSRVTLMRGIRKWTGSSEREDLLYELGKVIDGVVDHAPIFENDSNRGRERKAGRKNSSPEQ